MKQSLVLLVLVMNTGKEKSVTYSYACMVFLENLQIFILRRIVKNVPLSAGTWCNGPFQEKFFANFPGGMGDFTRRIFPFHDRKKRKRA